MVNHLMMSFLVAVAAFLVLQRIWGARRRIPGPQARSKVDEGAVLLDVRTEGEFRGGGLPGARNIPVQSLGARLEELSTERPIVVYCASGMRSARAASLLRSKGFEVYDLGPARAW